MSYFSDYYKKNEKKIKKYQLTYQKNYYIENKKKYIEKNIDIRCLYCNITIKNNSLKSHNNTLKHKNNINLFYLDLLPFNMYSYFKT